MTIRRWGLSVLLILLGATLGDSAHADYPDKPIRIITPYAAGGSTDFIARLIAQQLSTRLGQPVIVDNKPGGSEQIAAVTVKNSHPDGYTLFLTTTAGLAINPGLYKKTLQYDPLKDFTPIVGAAYIPSMLVVSNSVPVKTLGELSAYIRANPGKLNYASAGSGTPSHLGMEQYKQAQSLDIVHVPFKGGAPAVQSLLANQVQIMMPVIPEAMPMVKAAKVKALAIMSRQAPPRYPQLPTAAAQGLNLNLELYYAFVAPAKTPAAIVEKLNREVNAILQDPEVLHKFQEADMEPMGGTSQFLADTIAKDILTYRKVIDDADIKIE